MNIKQLLKNIAIKGIVVTCLKEGQTKAQTDYLLIPFITKHCDYMVCNIEFNISDVNKIEFKSSGEIIIYVFG